MGDNDSDTTTGPPTRREYVKYGGAVIGGGLLAGCTGESSSEGGTGAGATNTANETTTGGNTTENGEDPYSIRMAPMGNVAFDSVPGSVFTRLTHLAGMAFALGRGNDVNAMHAPDYYDALWNQFTPRLDGVSLDWSGLYSSWEPSKEKLYELNSDVHLADPAGVFSLDGWSRADVKEIRDNVAPWFGNYYSDRHAEPPAEWKDSYRYYGLWEMFEKVAKVFRENERYEALAKIHRELLDTIEVNRPPASERPTAVMALPTDFDEIYVYKVNNPGFLTAHTRPLGATEAFGDETSSGDTVDMEGLLEADPDVMLGLGGMHPETGMQEVREKLNENPVGKQLSAVTNDRVYAQGARYQGPILNLFQLEMTAKQLYPGQFGEWPTYTSGPYPEIPKEERLFDRQRVADIINGNL
ncbi:ABC transporter substrate-binding protein [Halococcus thailandensis]|uniref:Ferrichrome-binding protein n=1 Tax=Halococcus thailandensis JCM 13552 TaxID=1227457 RepID=M0MWY2_9EURY|nr:ABC transporter substrate-binding protein [Halococcus thailandensis]EMA50247.1 ferrichrome-binding protein [Halococcus thailandensis JCM 13552]